MAFSYKNKIYEQIDGASMGGSPRSVLANVIMTEIEKVQVLVKILIQYYQVLFRFVGNTLVFMKREYIDFVLKY